MKRSEMITFLTKFIAGQPYYEGRQLAEDILDALESKGMQPPSITSDDDNWNADLATERFEVWGWEEE